MRELGMGEIVDRLRINLEAAGIAWRDTEDAEMVEGGYLNQVLAFEEAARGCPEDCLPDYLADAGPEGAGREGSEVAGAATPAATAPGGVRGGDLMTMGIAQLASRLSKGVLSSVELAEESLSRIESRGTELNAFQLVLVDEARTAARAADLELRAGTRRGALQGIPVAVKDIFDLAGTPTRAGSIILGERAAESDSWAVERLREAGAVIVGKTRMSEFAYSPGSNNDHYGPVRNPRGPDRDSGGSSSGSAAAVAAGIVPAALGTDSGGSVRIPAAFCGLVGLKPTFGRLSLGGAVPLSWSCDHLGPLARSVLDAAILLDALAGRDPRDPRTRKTDDGPFAPALVRLGPRPLEGLRVGALAADGSGRALGSDEALAAWKAGLAALEDAGARIVELDMPELRAARALNSTIIAMEAAAFHAPTMRERHADYGEFTRLRMLAGFAYSPEDFVRAQRIRARVRRTCTAVFGRVARVSTPSMPRVAPSLGTPASLAFSSPFNLLGWPAITIPAGQTASGLPLGMQLAARSWDEATLLRAAAAAEERIGFA